MQFGHLPGLRLIQQGFQIVPKHSIVDLSQLRLLLGRERRAQKLSILYPGDFLRGPYSPAIPFKRPWNIGHIAFAGIMKETGQHHAV